MKSMKSEKNILIAFILNFAFSLLECAGGIFTGSVAILSDAVHDMGDAASIGIAWLLERKSKRQPDQRYTYGYARYSVLGGAVTSLILLLGSVAVVAGANSRIIRPAEIHYDGMILLAVFGVLVNGAAAFFTSGGHSLNQKAVNLHMLEDVLGWIVVLVGAVVMKFTDFSLIDPILSIGTAVFIFAHAVGNLKEAMELFLEKAPADIDINELKEHLLHIDGVLDVHHIHVWSMDGQSHYATMHVIAEGDPHAIKERIREELREHGIHHATLEMEAEGEECHDRHCHTEMHKTCGHHHHH